MPSRMTNWKAIAIAAVAIVAIVVLTFVFEPLATNRSKYPTGQAPHSSAPATVDTPESQKPKAQRESD